MFTSITPKEFFKGAWSKADAVFLAPNITSLIRRSTQLTSFVCAKILEETDIRQRVEVLKHFILIADVSPPPPLSLSFSLILAFSTSLFSCSRRGAGICRITIL